MTTTTTNTTTARMTLIERHQTVLAAIEAFFQQMQGGADNDDMAAAQNLVRAIATTARSSRQKRFLKVVDGLASQGNWPALYDAAWAAVSRLPSLPPHYARRGAYEAKWWANAAR